MPMKPTNSEEYLEQLPADQRRALERLRNQILAAAPGIEEHFGYGLPAFKYNGHPMLYIGAAKQHCALYGSVPAGFKDAFAVFSFLHGLPSSLGSVLALNGPRAQVRSVPFFVFRVQALLFSLATS